MGRNREPTASSAVLVRSGLDPVACALAVGAWLIVATLWVAGAVGGSFGLFLGVLLDATVAAIWLARAVLEGKGVVRGVRAALVIALTVYVPVVFDHHTQDVFNLPKYTLVVVGAIAIVGLWVVQVAQDRRMPRWNNGLQWPLVAIAAWTALSAFTGVDIHVSLLGDYGSYDGLYLALAVGVVMMATAEIFTAADIPKVLGAFGFVGAAVVVFYGLLQLHDVELHGATWDFIHWGALGFNKDIFSTFGNPNHLGGYLAMVLPIVVVLGFRSRHRFWQVAAGVFGGVVLVEILRTSARGAWVAVIASAVVLALCFVPEIRRRPIVMAGGAIALSGVVAVAMVVIGRRFIGHPLSTLFQSGGMSSVEQRFQLWAVAWHLALSHPFTGVGPDNFALMFPRHQSAAWVAALGPTYLANGAHNIVMNILADQGFVGLALFLALVAFMAVRVIGAWRRLRQAERTGSAQTAANEARAQRFVLAAVSASITAYLVQALFNVQQVGLTFSFWLLVGLLAVATAAAGVPATLRPGALVSCDRTQSDAVPSHTVLVTGGSADTPLSALASDTSPARSRRARRAVPIWQVTIAAVVAAGLVVVAAIGADGPYRADHDYWAAQTDLATLSSRGGSAAATSASASAAYFTDIENATRLNPWEASYPASEGSALADAVHTASPQGIRQLQLAAKLLAKAVADEPLWAGFPYAKALVDQELTNVDKPAARTYREATIKAARLAVTDNPRDPTYRSLLDTVLKAR